MSNLKNEEKKSDSIERWVFEISDFASNVKWSYDGMFVAVALVSGPIKIFNSKNGEEKTLDGHEFGTMEISWSPDNSKLASVGQDGHVKIWNVKTQKITKTLKGGSQWVEHVSWSPNGDYIASAAGKILKIWSSDGNLFQEYKEHPSTITAFQWNANGTEIATTSYGKILIFLIGVDEPKTTLPYPSSLVSLSWHSSGKWIVAGTQEGSLGGWELPPTDDSHFEINGYETKVTHLSWSKNGRNLASAGGSMIVIWDFSGKGPEGKEAKVLRDDRRITQMSYQNNGDLLVSGTKDGSILFWRPTVPEKPRLVFEVDGAISQLEWSKDGSSLVVCSEDGKVRIWKSPRG
ncbi:WD40 repeat domain-containing protein [Nitrosopumilus sp.]|uniref:WD40 repeat domain-containing protein n=1 Tax=Nitrosopumilus sp. TaxID=2024843 RepID=UPI00260CE937|nr:WD40 repeat domain-containing protein [Nitrosopumilus sp.]